MLPTATSQSAFRFGSFCLKFSFLLIFVLNFEFPAQNQIQKEIFQRDLHFCEQCFKHQQQNCTKFLQDIVEDEPPSKFGSFINLLSIPNKRLMQFWKIETKEKQNEKLISKSVTETQLQSAAENMVSNTFNWKTMFIDIENLEGLQLCPRRDSPRLVEYLEKQTQHSESSIWVHFALDVEALLMPLLATKGFPVPKTYATCGLTLFQAYAGKALVHYYQNEDFKLKLKISKALLTGVLKFSKGFDGFRVYITDLSADNLIWHEQIERLYFVDLDSIIILDSADKQLQRKVHKHIYIECNDCFAYSQQDICSHQLSDINLFAACQLLRENLSRQHEGGFLYPIPAEILEDYPKLGRLLDACVDCDGNNCPNRFSVAEQLLEVIEIMLKEF